MLRLRILASMGGTFLLFALLASGCSGDDEGKAAAQPAAADQLFTSGFQIDSANFQQRVRPYVRVPKKNSCFGENISPPLEWRQAPEGAKSFAVIAEDLDHSTGRWVQWVVYNIPADVSSLPEGIASSTPVLPDGTTQGTNDTAQPGYEGVCPPPVLYSRPVEPGGAPSFGRSPHRLAVTIYALDIELGLAAGATKAELEVAMEAHILGEAKTMGKFQPSVMNRTKLQFIATRPAGAEK